MPFGVAATAVEVTAAAFRVDETPLSPSAMAAEGEKGADMPQLGAVLACPGLTSRSTGGSANRTGQSIMLKAFNHR